MWGGPVFFLHGGLGTQEALRFRGFYSPSSILRFPSLRTRLFCGRFQSRRCFHHWTVGTEPLDLEEEAMRAVEHIPGGCPLYATTPDSENVCTS